MSYYRLTLSDSPTPPSHPSANRRLGTGPTTPSARRSTARSVYNESPASCCTRRRWASGCPRGGAGTGGVGRTPRFGAATAPVSKRWRGCGMACSGGYPPGRRCRGRINTRMLTRCTSRASPRPRPRCGRNEGDSRSPFAWPRSGRTQSPERIKSPDKLPWRPSRLYPCAPVKAPSHRSPRRSA
jgi:hypothetical protein